MPKIILTNGDVIETERLRPSKARIYYRLEKDTASWASWHHTKYIWFHWVSKKKVAFFTKED